MAQRWMIGGKGATTGRRIVLVVALVLAGAAASVVGAPPADAAVGPYASAVLAASPAAYWRLGEPAGATTAADASGLGRTGAYVGGVSLGSGGAVSSENDAAATFDGISGGVTVPDDPALRLNGAFTIELWAKMSRFANSWPGLVLKGSSSTADGYLIYYDSAGRLSFKRNGVEVASASGALATSRYAHLAVVYDGSRVVWYVDGAVSTTTNVVYPTNAGTSALILGRGDQFGAESLDDVAIYKTALTATQIADHVSAASGVAPPPTPDPVVVTAGDISCAASDPNFSGANPALCQANATANLVRSLAPTAVVPLGDLVYGDRTVTDFQTSYARSWGALGSSFAAHPVLGNHDYGGSSASLTATSTAPGYFGYFGTAVANPAGAQTAAGQPGGWYSYDIGRWHVVVLNHECAPAGGCGVGSRQDQWLVNDLATHSGQCTVAFGHEPRWSDLGDEPALQTVWQRLVDGHVTLLVSGHDHNYQRFAPRDAAGRSSAAGVRQFVVGTGGNSHEALPGTTTAEYRNATEFGVLKLGLRASGYDWQFVTTSGAVRDAGTGTCASAPPPPPPPSGYANIVLASSPVGYWRLGDAAGAPVADASGNAHPGTAAGGVTMGVAGALVGDANSAASFDGVNGVVNVPDAAALRLNGPFTIELWAKMSRFVNSWPGLVLKGSSSTADGYLVYYSSNGQVRLKRNNREFATTAGALATARYSHLVVTFDGTTVRWFVDGVLNSTSAATFPVSAGTAPLALGRGDQYGAQSLDEIAFFATALSATVVGQHYAAGHG